MKRPCLPLRTMLCYLLPGIVLSACFSSAPAPYRDLNKNGKMDIYEDASQPVENRIADLVSQMTLDEKAGLMFINGVRINDDGSIGFQPPKPGAMAFGENAEVLMRDKKMNHFNLWFTPPVAALAKWYNNVQRYAADSTRLGIPVTIASDPRNAFSDAIFSMKANGFSLWPEQLGFAAVGDTALMREFADISRQEYLAVGIRESLHPQIDLATEPRWARIMGTFGEDAQLSAKLVSAYIGGYQGSRLGPQSVATMTKHFSGGGPQKEGLDPHFEFQKGQIYPGNNFNYHLIPFEAAFKAGTAAIMPYYGVPVGQTNEDVGFAFNKMIVTDLLRNKYKFDGVVCTDWGLVNDVQLMPGVIWPARAWGVEKSTPIERVKKIIEAGCDQFGGENCPEHVIRLVQNGELTEERINASVKRLLRQKFELGLFDNPFIDAARATEIVGKPSFMQAGEKAQRRSMTLLKNDNLLPLNKPGIKIFVQNIDTSVAAKYATVVSKPEEADLAIIRLKTPWVPVQTNNFIAMGFHHGDLDFKGKQKDSILALLKKVPTIVDIYLDRPAVIPEINAAAKALLANYGSSDAAVLDVIFGKAKPEGRLPFELPSSMEAVKNQREDVPYDSKDPLYRFGFGLSYH